MAVNLSAEEFKNECIENMGQELGLCYYNIYNELTILYIIWKEYSDLYRTKQLRKEIMHKSASFFFTILYGMFSERLVIGIARLIDSSKYKNISIYQLISIEENTELKDKVSGIINDQIKKIKSLRLLRNKKFAHLDYKTITEELNILDAVTFNDIKEIIDLVADVLNVFSDKYLNKTILFDYSIGDSGDAQSLLYYLQYGLKFENEKEERIRNGAASRSDFEHPDI